MKFEIENHFSAEAICEFSVAIGDYSYLVIYGKHINGYFCCVPAWKWGCEMANPHETVYNREKLMECGADEVVAKGIALAIEAYLE